MSCLVYAGATADLLSDPTIGRAVDPIQVEQLATALAGYATARPARIPDAVAQRSIDYYSPDRQAARALTSIEKALGRVR